MAVQSDGKIVVAGFSYNGNNSYFALARYNANGTLDTSFDGDGKLTTAFGASGDEGNSVAVQSDGKIVVAGFSNNGINNDFALARYEGGSTPPTLLGDYNQNSVVDAADYVAWRKTLGTTGLAAYTGADGSGNGTIDLADYGVWRAHFGQTPPPTLLGDYNQNSVVDAADYIAWRKTLGATGLVAYTGADGSGNGTIDPADYNVWRAHFGQTPPPPGAGSGVNSATASAAPVAPVDESVLAGTSMSLSVNDLTQTAELLGASGAKQDASQHENHPSVLALASSLNTSYRPSVQRSLGTQRPVPASRRDDALVAWLASQPDTKKQLEDSGATKTRESEEVSGADDIAMDSSEQVFALLDSTGSVALSCTPLRPSQLHWCRP